ncbi:hypothetical protein SAMN05421837_102824 [Amycolatopsis pretoriensis]|uniref:Uncharacterized protein n=1 Tax=Amycolatopsis pretoriensis TaxID=218821 RepID=A0A1H5QEY9_9PSEU|nr:hypothetical protein [Amycolatopsis pretoriensis]SEF24702.1 hypothetical protein SAMN05421837_102824 [Amycolatopsis pretoriensis]
MAIGEVVRTFIDCAAEGLDPSVWDDVLGQIGRRDGLLDELFTINPPIDVSKNAIERTLDLPTSVRIGDGFSSASRLASAWSRDRAALDLKLQAQLPHLLDPDQTLTVDVWLHLAGLLAGENPLPSHQAAVAGRNLTLAALAKDMSHTLEVVISQANQEGWMLTTHRQLIDEISTFHSKAHPEDKIGPACNAYLAIMEGDIRRTTRMIFGLLGFQVGPDETLGSLEQRLAAKPDNSACVLLLSCINRKWRNAAAHAQFRWDPIEQKMLLGDVLADPDDLIEAAIRAHSICKGFYTGVTVALNREGDPHQKLPPSADPVSWAGKSLRRLGILGIEVTKLRRDGTTIQLYVPPLNIHTLRDHLVGVVAAGHDIPDAEDWEIIQDDRPTILLDAKTILATKSTAEVSVDDGAALHPHTAELVLYTGALLNSGTTPQAVARSVTALAASTVLGERDLLKPRLHAHDDAALMELTETIRRVDRGVRAAMTLLPRPARRRLASFLTMLSTQLPRPDGSFEEIADGLDGVVSARQASTPINFPWILEQGEKT